MSFIRGLSVSLLLLLCGLATSCGGGGDSGPAGNLGPEGGVVIATANSPIDGARIFIPPGLLTFRVNGRLSVGSEEGAGVATYARVGPVVDVSLTVPGTALSVFLGAPGNLLLPYNPALADGQEVVAFHLREGSSVIQLNGVVQHSPGLISVPFRWSGTYWAMVRIPPPPEPPPPPPIGGTWSETSLTAAPFPQLWHSLIWTGSKIIVWGGQVWNGTDYAPLVIGDVYDPVADTWYTISTTGAPFARILHTAVWTGNSMIIWGGTGAGSPDTGGIYNLNSNTWTSTTRTGAPPGSWEGHSAIWTGSRMIVWGGRFEGVELGTGGSYDPVTNSWTTVTTAGAPTPRQGHKAVWTGSRMIIWGGTFAGVGITNGASYDPETDTWTPLSNVLAPDAGDFCTAVWTGSRMLVWGGRLVVGPQTTFFNTGRSYDPVTDTWTPISTFGAPEPRAIHTAVWTGNHMVIWGGQRDDRFVQTGGWWDPVSDSWLETTVDGSPEARVHHSAVWIGDKMVVWGGQGDITYPYLNSGGVLTPWAGGE